MYIKTEIHINIFLCRESELIDVITVLKSKQLKGFIFLSDNILDIHYIFTSEKQ